jgi:hypothetical protein
VSARAVRDFDGKRTGGQIPLRFLHTVGASFTLPIRQRPQSKEPPVSTFFPLSLKRLCPESVRRANERPQAVPVRSFVRWQ